LFGARGGGVHKNGRREAGLRPYRGKKKGRSKEKVGGKGHKGVNKKNQEKKNPQGERRKEGGPIVDGGRGGHTRVRGGG